MITAESVPLEKDVVIEATIRSMIQDGSKTFLAGAVAIAAQNYGVNVTGAYVGRYFNHHPAFENIIAAKGKNRWKLVGEL